MSLRLRPLVLRMRSSSLSAVCCMYTPVGMMAVCNFPSASRTALLVREPRSIPRVRASRSSATTVLSMTCWNSCWWDMEVSWRRLRSDGKRVGWAGLTLAFLEHLDEGLDTGLDLPDVALRVVDRDFEQGQILLLEQTEELVLDLAVAGAELQVGVNHAVHRVLVSQPAGEVHAIL